MKFARTMMDLANYNFEPNKTKTLINSYKNSYRQQIADTYARFHSGSLSGDNGIRRFEESIATLTEFYNKRYPYAERTTRNAMKLSGEPHKLTVVNTADKGSIKLNSLDLGKISSWSGNYHADYDLHLTAAPVEGQKFSHWVLNGAKLSSGELTDTYIKVRIENDASVQAVYVGDADEKATTTVQTTTKAVTTTTTTAKTTAATAKTTVTTAKTTATTKASTKPVTTTTSKPLSLTGLKSLSKVVQAETYDFKSGIDTEDCSEGGKTSAASRISTSVSAQTAQELCLKCALTSPTVRSSEEWTSRALTAGRHGALRGAASLKLRASTISISYLRAEKAISTM